MAPKVLIADAMSPRAEQVFKDRGVEYAVKPGLSPKELIAEIPAYQGLAVRSASKATAEVIAAAPDLKVIGRAGIGVDNIDVPAATQRGVVVMNTPFGNAITAAEHAISMMLSLARMIPQANASTHAGKWEKSRFVGVEVMDKTLGVIGCGNIGAIAADRALGLKMRVIAFDPFLSPERAAELGVEKVELDNLLKRADFITLHTPLTDKTRGILGAAALAKTKAGVRIINCARGGLVVEADLKAALDSGQVAGAALDVFEEEPARENPLFGMDNVIATPHLGASTSEAQEKVAVQVAEQMADYLLTGAIRNALNVPSMTAEEAARLKPYLDLAGQLGSFAGQVSDSAVKAVSIEYEGAVAAENTKPLSAAALAGLLRPSLETVNVVSAPSAARGRGIDVTSSDRDVCKGFQTLIRVTVTTGDYTRDIAGTLFGGKPRVVSIKGIPVDAALGPHMLFITNHDKPGMIGALGAVLGDAGVNIATFSLGRAEPGGDAIALLQVDGPPAAEVLKKLAAVPGIVKVKALRF
ncbi:MAG: phosphoglycerate dehydrogenase [Rhodospirillales bacterium]